MRSLAALSFLLAPGLAGCAVTVPLVLSPAWELDRGFPADTLVFMDPDPATYWLADARVACPHAEDPDGSAEALAIEFRNGDDRSIVLGILLEVTPGKIQQGDFPVHPVQLLTLSLDGTQWVTPVGQGAWTASLEDGVLDLMIDLADVLFRARANGSTVSGMSSGREIRRLVMRARLPVEALSDTCI